MNYCIHMDALVLIFLTSLSVLAPGTVLSLKLADGSITSADGSVAADMKPIKISFLCTFFVGLLSKHCLLLPFGALYLLAKSFF